MARNYTIDFSDPLTGSFNIPDAGFNGPGGKASDTSLRLYGRGAPEWGESVDENFSKLLENFMGASTPHYPVAGQLWIKTYYYYYDTTNTVFYRWNIDQKVWQQFTVIVSTTEPAAPATGQYWYNPNTTTLSRFFQLYKQQTALWHARWYRQGAGAPGSAIPDHTAMMFDSPTGTWGTLPVVNITADTAAPDNGRSGTLRFDPVTGHMYFWNIVQSGWTQFGVGGSNPVIFNDLNMGNYRITSLSAPTAPDNALNLGYADSRYVLKAGDSMTGHIVQGAGNPTQALHLATKAYVDTTSTNAAAAAVAALVTVPSGVIVMWSGSVAAIPSGWVLCNGANGTPNLTDRFVIGAGLSYAPADTGGSKDAVVVAHDHPVGGTTTVAGDHIHTIGDPGHAHNVSTNRIRISIHDIESGVVWGGETASGNKGYAEPAGTGISLGYAGAHQHSLTGSVGQSGQSGAGANLPPYYALCFIMKT